MNLVLVGLMGSGKSTVGRELARRLGRSFIDTDYMVEERSGRTIAEIFRTDGEAAFRHMESQMIAEATGAGGAVIATGGGSVLLAENRDLMRQDGLVIWLEAPTEELLRRATSDGLTTRPLLGDADPMARLEGLSTSRAEVYGLAAHLRVSTGGRAVEDVVTEIMAHLRQAAPVVRVPVDLADRSYPIEIAMGGLARLGEFVRQALPKATRCLIISDQSVAAIYGDRCVASIVTADIQAGIAVVAPGEGSKALGELGPLYSACAAAGLERSSVIVALGGGVVGDLAGFVAATYLRGVAFVQVPTTLLAQVDSSVGGKTGIDLPEGKNLVGAFHQPALVLTDPATLDTLPERELSAGMAEVVKHAVIRDAAFLELLEVNAERILALDPALISLVIAQNCQIKAAVVSADEREGGLRAILNFGHTIGHAVEALMGFDGWRHGECVAFGMVAATRIARATGVLQDSNLLPRLESLLTRLRLPTRLPTGLDLAGLAPLMQRDKKVAGGRIHWVLPVRPGVMTVTAEVPAEVIWQVLEELVSEGGTRG